MNAKTMTVKKLIEELSKFPDHYEVFIAHPDEPVIYTLNLVNVSSYGNHTIEGEYVALIPRYKK